MRNRWIATLVLVLMMVGVGMPQMAWGNETVDELAPGLGIQDEPTDYVVMVDTSVSMVRDGRWGNAGTALEGLLANLKAEDHVTLITFDDGARTVWQGDAPDDATVLLDALPAAPTGDQTDIGAAIDEAVVALSREGGNVVAAVALLTDGRVDAAADSPYRDLNGPAWEELRLRAARASEARHVGTFAVALDAETDAGLLTAVFPEAQVITPDDVVGFLSGLDQEIKRTRVVEVLSADVGIPLAAAITGHELDGSTATFSIGLTSGTQHVPLSVVELLLSPAIEGATIQADPLPLELEPGATATTALRVTLPEQGAWEVAVEAVLASPWDTALADLGIVLPASVTSETVQLVVAAPSAPEPVPEPGETESTELSLPTWWPIAVGVIVGLLLLWLVSKAISSRLPQLSGSIALWRDGQVVEEHMLVGRKFETTHGELRLLVRPGKGDTVSVGSKQDGKWHRATLNDGESFSLGEDLELRYTSERSRMLEMVNAP